MFRTYAVTAAVLLAAGVFLPATSGGQAFNLGVREFQPVGTAAYFATVGDLNGDGTPDLVTTNSSGGTVTVQLGHGYAGFGAPAAYATGTGIAGTAAIADLNGDGVPDLLVRSGLTLSVFLGDGKGGFGAATNFPAGSGAQGLAVADLNGDGRLDVVVANAIDNTVSVLLGDGLGGFGARSAFATGLTPVRPAIGDLNGDGHPDLVVANNGSNTVSVLLGNGDGTFAAKTDIVAASALPIDGAALADLNGDGHLDMVGLDRAANMVSVLLGDGSGGFGGMAEYPTGPVPYNLAIADMNGDGRPDLVTSNAGNQTVSVLPGNGDGTFGTKTDVEAGVVASSVTAADMNVDGNLDLLIPNGGAPFNGVTILLAAGGFTPETDYAVGTNPIAIAIGDLNGDSRPDLVVANSTSSTVSVLQANPAGGFLGRVDYATGLGPQAVAVADLDNDGHTDIVTAGFNGLTGVSVLLNNGSGGFPTHVDYGTGRSADGIVAGDFNHDGRLDLVTANFTDNNISWLPGIGGGIFGPHHDYTTGTGPVGIAMGDLNNDANLDVVTANGTAGTVSVLLGNGAGGFAAHADFPGGPNVQAVAIGDLNGDGFQDLVVANANSPSSPPGAVTVLLGHGNGTFASGVTIPIVGSRPYSVALADVNNDGHLDVVTACMYSDAAYVMLGDGAGNLGPSLGYHAGPGNFIGLQFPLAVAVGDLNGDSRPDIALAEYGSNAVSVLYTPDSTHVTLSTNVNPILLGTPLVLTATVTAFAPGTPTGTVSFYDGTTPVGSWTLAGGTVSLALAATVLGVHPYTAVYSGDLVFSRAMSTPYNELVSATAVPLVMQAAIVPAGPGGFVSLGFVRSPLDFPGAATAAGVPDGIMRYDAYRKVAVTPTLAMGFTTTARVAGAPPQSALIAGWQLVASTPALAESLYHMPVPTLADSNASGTHWTSFFVRAVSVDASVFYDSAPDSGYSVDYLPPDMPVPFTAAYAAGATHLHWGASTDPDFGHFQLYRTPGASVLPAPAYLIASQPDTGFVDAGSAGSTYFVSAVDVNGNASGYATLGPAGTAAVDGGASLAFSLGGARPNPARGAHWSVSFTLPTAEPVRLELLDVNGRRLVDRALGAPGPGRHDVDLADGRRLAPGLYLVRLSQGVRTAITRVAVIQ